MSYITYNDLVNAFGEGEIIALSDRDRDGLQDDGIIDEAIAFADSHIDGYLRERYSVPLTNCPANLQGMACDFARYRLYQDQPTELVQNRYDVGCFFLKDVARGLVQLDTSDASDAPVAYSQPTAIFTRLVW
jgi:phage gp36-like protein